MPDALESSFQQDIIDALVSNGWRVGSSAAYDRERALYPEDVVGFLSEAHPDQWAKFCKMYPENPEDAILRSVAKELEKKGTLEVLRKHYGDRGARIQMCRFKPDHGLNEDTERQYACNRLRVVPELVYSPHDYVGRLDLTLFVNGIPVATMELKSEFKQSVYNAIRQYKKDRPPKDPKTRKAEPLLKFKRGALVHFAVSQEEAFMCTRLAGNKSFFLPFNKGTEDGGAGNPQSSDPNSYATEYLWKEVLQPDNFLRILGRFLHLEVKETTDWEGKKKKKETMIFPRFHQWDAVNKLIDTAREEGPGHKYLIQHSAGSGKSNSIAWSAHQLSSLYDAEDRKVFDSVIVITDRTLLDNQLQETIFQFDHRRGVVTRVSRDYGDGSKSEQLANALEEATSIIIVTIQTFPFVLKLLQERTSLKGRTYAVIADEAHSSQTGSTAQKLREVLNLEQVDEDAELSAEELLQATLAARRDSDRISYFAFTATPKPKTLELFGRRPKPEFPASSENIPEAFHVYTMRQAIEERFILDVLKNYTTYAMAYKLAHTNPDNDKEVDTRKGATTIAKWVRHHPHNIATKVEVIIEHFRTRVAALLNGQAKAMVVTSSRLAAVRYKLAFDKYIAEHPQCRGIQAMVAFSGDVEDVESGPEPFNENNMNPNLKKRDMRKAFDTPEFQVMIVANKFQTGFDQPKLCAMYVDKKLMGVDCVQTLSRLNRTYPGKDQTFVLDFVNKPEDIREAFQPYYKVSEIGGVSDPNLVYELKDKLDGQDIYRWEEVEAFVEAFFSDKASQAQLMHHCRPAKDRFSVRYKEVMAVVREAEKVLREAKKTGNEVVIKNAKTSYAEAKKGKDVLDIFKRDLKRFTRFYEFVSQIIDFDDKELEKLSIYGRHLLPLLREERLDDDVDLSDIEMTHYRLAKKREEQIKLENEDGSLRPPSDESAKPKERETERLSEIVARMNALFDGEFTDGDALSYARTIVTKLRENDRVMTQLRENSPAQAMKGDFPAAVEDAVIESMETHSELAQQFLGKERVRKGFAKLVMDLLLDDAEKEAWKYSMTAQLSEDISHDEHLLYLKTMEVEPSGEEESEEPSHQSVEIFYGTDRLPEKSEKWSIQYGNEISDGEIFVGKCVVSVPKRHSLGELERPVWWKLEREEDDKRHFVLTSIDQYEEDRFLSEVQAEAAQSEEKTGLVFVHGFNTTFEEAAWRTAQLVYDLKIDLLPFMFSWPSKGGLKQYPSDEESVDLSVPHLESFLSLISSVSDLEKIHIIAHSMGNRAMTQAVINSHKEKNSKIDQVVLAAPDINAKKFTTQLSDQLASSSRNVTLYASSGDKALRLSKEVHGYRRAGESGDGLLVLDGIETVDASNVDTDWLGHTYFAKQTSLLSDLFMIVKHGHKADERQLSRGDKDGKTYWLFPNTN